ncbi:MAG: DUF309 domain-containing protein [Mycolicibacterium sp.]|nr:DUF309 domain-containing protein [Mycolicibacterium sp.]
MAADTSDTTRDDRARDRDETGRARNARPRDALGRPLPRGSAGVPRVPDDATFTPDEALRQAQDLIDGGGFFHAHEVFEAVWKTCPPDERWLWRGLAQVAVGVTHVQRGNPSGARALLQRGRDALTHPHAPYDVDVAGVVAFADRLLENVGAGDHVDTAGFTLRVR